ncbi:MAG TPA: DUF1800 domain-containing protein, partial [Chitinophagaceae bacterium]|nr:DUF1800 domain-containing protein [Chitinophagaceae bacterium]
RHFLTAAANSTSAPHKLHRTQSGLNPYSGKWTRNEVQHLLKRTMFGATKADIDYFSAKTMVQTVTELLNINIVAPSPPVNDYNSSTADPAVPAGQTWINNQTNDGTINSLRRASFKKWWTGLMINQERSILEKMTLFWSNHFGTETSTIGNANYVYHHHALLRKNAVGNFKQLLKAVTIDAGMLRYLNGYLNTATAPDENYGRELQELFVIGKEPTVQYTEDDVKKAAKVLTGWRINGTTFTTFFDPTKHDTSSKQFSSFYNGTVITGKTGTAGANETDELINMLLLKEDAAKHICRRLYRWFIYYKIDAATEANVIQPLATLFRNSNFEIKPVLSALLSSEHFFDVVNMGCQIKSPVDLVISPLREFKVTFPNTGAEYLDAYAMWNYIRNWMTTMSQDIGDPPDVSGWAPYYQAPQFYEIWINSDTLPKRNRYTDTMISSGYTRNNKKIIIDAVAFAKSLPNPADPNKLLDDILGVIFRVPLSVAARQTIKQQILLSNQVSDQYWTDAWNIYMSNTANVGNYNIVNNRLKTLLQYLMNLPEYQLA